MVAQIDALRRLPMVQALFAPLVIASDIARDEMGVATDEARPACYLRTTFVSPRDAATAGSRVRVSLRFTGQCRAASSCSRLRALSTAAGCRQRRGSLRRRRSAWRRRPTPTAALARRRLGTHAEYIEKQHLRLHRTDSVHGSSSSVRSFSLALYSETDGTGLSSDHMAARGRAVPRAAHARHLAPRRGVGRRAHRAAAAGACGPSSMSAARAARALGRELAETC